MHEQPEPVRPIARHTPWRCIGVLLAGAVSVILWWDFRVEAPIVRPTTGLAVHDTYTYYYPMFRFGFAELLGGRFPFWNPYQHCGVPFFATAQTLLLYPLNILYLLLPFPIAMKGTLLLHLLMGFGFAVLLGRTLQFSFAAALTTGVVFVFCPTVASLIYLPHHMYGAVWIPLHLALAHLMLTRKRQTPWALLLGVTVAAQYLGGYPMYTLFSLYVIWGYFAWMVVVRSRSSEAARFAGRGAIGMVVAMGVAGCLSAPQLLPALELSQLSSRSLARLTIDQVDSGYGAAGSPFHTALAALFPVWRADLWLAPRPYVGPVVAVLVCLAPWHRRLRGAVGFALTLTLVSYLLSLGRATPLFWLYFHLPTANMFRLPVRFLILTSLGLALLTGVGVDFLWQGGRARPLWFLVGGIGLVAGLTFVVPAHVLAGQIVPMSTLEFSQRSALLSAYLIAVIAWLVCFLTVPLRIRRAMVAMLPLCLYAAFWTSFLNSTALPETHPNLHTLPESIVDFLHAEQRYDRTLIATPDFALTPSKAGILHRLFVVGDRENVYPELLSDYMARIHPVIPPGAEGAYRWAQTLPPQGELPVTSRAEGLHLLDLLGARFIVESPGGRFREAGDEARFPLVHESDGVRVYANPRAVPRAYVALQAEVITTPERVLDRLVDPTFDPTKVVILEKQPPEIAAVPPTETPPTAQILSYEPGTVEIAATTESPGFLVLTDQYYPGWTADVDGRPTPIYRADYMVRAVPLSAGSHRVRFRFVPWSFYQGLGLAGIGVLLIVALTVADAWRVRRVRAGR